jgi:hypothetical protein
VLFWFLPFYNCAFSEIPPPPPPLNFVLQNL